MISITISVAPRIIFNSITRKETKNPWTYSEVVTAGCQDCFMCVEFLLFGNKGDITKYAITSLLVQGCQDSIVMGAGLTKPLTCQHFLNAERGKGKDFVKKKNVGNKQILLEI